MSWSDMVYTVRSILNIKEIILVGQIWFLLYGKIYLEYKGDYISWSDMVFIIR